ncbi:hypothetical protein [Adhaeribacter aquaticus]|uniref:hypothetical protein n=1 Tax=Adhaeribacter aquaticus TaxID=299567 RepID=UPI000410C16C|nr:hypothetical protein [Adhaeribacter aquaticus]
MTKAWAGEIQINLKDKTQQVFDNEFLSIQVISKKSLLILIWKRQITLNERKEGYTLALSITAKNNITFWLVDDLQLFFIGLEEMEWLATEWIETASNSSLLKVGVVSSDYYPALIANTEFTNSIGSQFQSRTKIQHEVFTDYITALNWLSPDKP